MTKARTLADNYAADINQVSAGVGITGGGTSGTVTITNDMATTIAAKGDLVAGTANDAYAALTVGANDTVLTADSSTATGLKWAAPSSGGMTLLSTTSLSGSTTTISSIPSGYTNLFLQIGDYDTSGGSGYVEFVCNGTTNLAHYWTVGSTAVVVASNGAPIRPAGSNAVQGTTNGTYWLQISDYANTSNFKSFFCAGMMETTSASSNAGFAIGGLRTTDAITSIDVKVSAGTQTGTARLYGVK